MEIAILGTRGIPARYGGFETFAEKLALGLSQHGYGVTVFCEREAASAPQTLGRVKLCYVSAPPFGPLRTLIYDCRCLWVARRDFEVVYMLGYGAALFCFIPRLWGNQVWINPDGLEWARTKWGVVARAYFKVMEWLSLRVANHVIADAASIAECLRKRHGGMPPHTIIPYGCEVVDEPPPAQILSGWNLLPKSYFLVVCRLEPENHVFEIMQAFQRSTSHRELIILGNLQKRTRYVEKLLSVQDARIRMLGTIYDGSKLEALRVHAFGYMHGHSVGGTNPSLLEAMGCGSLVFAHDNAFNRETLGNSGLFFSNAQGLTEKIEAAEAGDHDLNLLRERAKHRARTQYQWRDIIDRYVDLIKATATRSFR
jgi:glycosyltransferase involved in cell wall biosynthesis